MSALARVCELNYVLFFSMWLTLRIYNPNTNNLNLCTSLFKGKHTRPLPKVNCNRGQTFSAMDIYQEQVGLKFLWFSDKPHGSLKLSFTVYFLETSRCSCKSFWYTLEGNPLSVTEAFRSDSPGLKFLFHQVSILIRINFFI